ncbi:CPSF A subunit region containing protein [Babesia ovata]|uniref:CPSF A subunit region containing protein n=1 Tax=Babesia ovata TaxID=189622 RepID=A0A2H6KII4_9APIC|nr:CPSF A subunit region containing protein [Babesia ovata]GBE62796.1 CPSF A subunit region containing protein [Babesia ovata]
MSSKVRLAYSTLCDATSADAVLHGSFRYPGSDDVVIVQGRRLVLYTLLSTADGAFVPQDRYDPPSCTLRDHEDAVKRFGSHVVSESLRFVSETALMDAPIATRVLHDCVLHSYRRVSAPDDEQPSSDSAVAGTVSPTIREAVATPLDCDKDTPDAAGPESTLASAAATGDDVDVSEHVRDEFQATSALLLTFEHGRLLTCAFNVVQNTFITLSMHALDRRLDPKDEAQYASLPIREKMRIASVKEPHVSVCEVHGWRLISRRNVSKQSLGVYGRRFLIAMCFNERIVQLLPIVFEFSRNVSATSHCYQPLSEHQDSVLRPGDTDQHSVTFVPWLRAENMVDFDVDSRLGFCDGRYFVRGLDLVSHSSLCILGLLVSTKPESVGVHVIEGEDYVIGGMSYVAISVNCRSGFSSVIQRMDSLPMDTCEILAVPASIYGTAGFMFRSLDFLMWVTVMSPTLCWQFVSPTGLINTCFDSASREAQLARFLDAMYLDIDLNDCTVGFAGNSFVLVPRRYGQAYIGRPVCGHEGVMRDIFWTKLGELDFEVSASALVMVDGRMELLASGSGVDLARYSVCYPPGFLEFELDTETVESSCYPYEVEIAEIPTKVVFTKLLLREAFTSATGEGSLDVRVSLANVGALRDPKNVSLPELWQVGCVRPVKDGGNEEELPLDDRVVPKYKPQRRPYAVHGRQVTEIATVDYVWPKQQSLVGLCDDSKIVVLMEKYPLHSVISIPLQRGSTLIPLEYTSQQFSTEEDTQFQHSRDTSLLLTWQSGTCTVDLNEYSLAVQCSSALDRRQALQHTAGTEPPQMAISTDETTLCYGTVLGNRFAVQITPTKAAFIELRDYTHACSMALTEFDAEPNSSVWAAEVADNVVVCLFRSGNVAVLSVAEDSGAPSLTIVRRISGGVVQHISLYWPRRVNSTFDDVCLLVLTTMDTLFCYRMHTFERVFAFKGITQVFPRLFSDNSEELNITAVDVEKQQESPSAAAEVGQRRVDKRTRATSEANTPDEEASSATRSNTRAKVTATKSRSNSSEDEQQGGTDVSASEPNPPCATDAPDCTTQEPFVASLDFAIERWNKLRHYEGTLEYVISIRMLDISPTDLGPTLLVLMTGRPLLVYRSYLVSGTDYVFELFTHRFVHPVPSAYVEVNSTASPNHRLLMQLNRERNVGSFCIRSPLLGCRGITDLDQSDLNHATVSYPHISTDDVVYYSVGAESTELGPSAKPLSRSEITPSSEFFSAIETLNKRWNNFRPPCLRLTSICNRLRIHEYEVENALDMDTVLGDAESRVTCLYSIVTEQHDFSRYVVFLTQPGTLVVCVPGMLHQETSINGYVGLQEIIAGSDDAEYLTSKRASETTWNPLLCRLESEDSQSVRANLFCRRLRENAGGIVFSGDMLSHMSPLGNMRGSLMAVSNRNYYLSNGVIRANRNATIATLQSGSAIHPVYCGKLIAVVVRTTVDAKEELTGVLNDRIKLQLRQLESETLPPGTKPIEIIEPNKQICTFLQTIDLFPQDITVSKPVWRDIVLVLHMGDLHHWFAEYRAEPMESILSLTFGIIGNREYLLVGTCTNLGENIESKGDVTVIDLQSLFQRQPCPEDNAASEGAKSIRRSRNCITLTQYCKRIFPGAVSFLSSLNTDFDLIFRPNFNFQEDLANIGKSDNVMIYGNEDSRRWTLSHFMPNYGLFVHSVGSRLFVHEVSGKQFLRGAFAEVPLCVSTACVFDKCIVAGDLNRGLHFFMYRHDAVNDSRTLCKIGSTVQKVDLSVVACAPLVNRDSLGLMASDYYANLLLFSNESESSGRDTLVVTAALRLPTRVTHFVRREPDFRHVSVPSAALGFCADGSVLLTFMPESGIFQFFKNVQSAMDSCIAPPLGVNRCSTPFFTSQMSQTQAVWPGDESVLHLDILRKLPFQTESFLSGLCSRMSEEGSLPSYQLLHALYSGLLSV